MKKEPKFFICKHCGHIVTFINESGAPLSCCGDKMNEILPNTTEAAVEKHIPVVTTDGNLITINVGSVPHPMTEEHYIQWIYLETSTGFLMTYLNATDSPIASFELTSEKAIAAYAYCNLHGLWKVEL